MAEVQRARAQAERVLGATVSGGQMTKAQIKKMILALRDIAAALSTADPKLKAKVYAELGVRTTYDHGKRPVIAEADPCTPECVGEGTSPLRRCPSMPGELVLR